jgi:uncharacterized membrane protein
MNFIEKNKKELVIIFVVIILALGTSMIYVILNPSLNLKEYEDTSNYFDNTDYYISNETNT